MQIVKTQYLFERKTKNEENKKIACLCDVRTVAVSLVVETTQEQRMTISMMRHPVKTMMEVEKMVIIPEIMRETRMEIVS